MRIDGSSTPGSGSTVRAPAAVCACALMAAGLVAGYLGPAAATAALGGALAVLTRRPGPAVGWAWVILTVLVGIRFLVAVEAARQDAAAWWELAQSSRPVPLRVAVRVEWIRSAGASGWSAQGTADACPRPCAGSRLRWRGKGEAPRPGEIRRLDGRLMADPPRSLPGARYPPAGLGPGARRGVLLEARTGPPEVGRAPFLSLLDGHIRDRLAARFEPSLEPLALALLLGDRVDLDPALMDAFTASGTLHLLAVSGLQVAFLAALMHLGLGLAGLAPRPRAAATAFLLAVYTALVGAPPSIVRGALMAVVVVWARADERRISMWQPWGLAAMAVLAWRPLDLLDLGFALSFGAVAGLLAGAPLDRLLSRRGRTPGRFLLSGLVATTASTLGTLPIQAAAFGWIAPAGFPVNPAAVPLSCLSLPALWMALLADATGIELLAAPLTRTAAVTIGALQGVVTLGGKGAPIWVPGELGWTVGSTALFAAALLMVRWRPRVAVGAAAFGLALLLATPSDRFRGWEVVWLDVGQGDAVVIHFPEGATWLVDAGPAYPFGDAGRSVVLPYLRRRGVSRLDWLITTHADLDHVGGASSVVRGLRVSRWGSPMAVDDNRAWLELLAASAAGPSASTLRAGQRFRRGGVAIDVLHPSPEWVPVDPWEERPSANEGSIVLLMSRGPCRLLLMGDLGTPGEEALVDRLADSLSADLLHVGHHGSRHSSSAPFLARVRPTAAVVSVGRSNRYGHPHPDALARLEVAGARVYRTDRQGPVHARCEALGWRVETPGFYLRGGH